MFRYVRKRLVYSILTLWVLITITFFLMHSLPGDPFIGQKPISQEAKAALYARYGLDQPVMIQYVKYIGNAVRGDFGESMVNQGQKVSDMIARAFPYSFDLGIRALTFAIILGVLVLCAIFVPVFSGYSISEQDLMNTNIGFLKQGHLFGTDNLGRDVFTRIWYGTRISLTIALAAVMIGLFVGAIYGGAAGYFGGNVDNIMMRIVDVIIAIPYMIIVILLMVVLKPGIGTIIIAYAAVGWTDMARLVRGQVIRLKESEYVLASRIMGAGPWYIIIKDLLPNTLSVIIVNLTLTIPGAIFAEAFLSYIGLGVQIPLASLGTLASDGVKSMQLYPHLLIVPSAVLCLIMLTFNLLGDVLRDILDPKLRK